MEAVVIQCDIPNHSRDQLQITIPPPESTVVLKLIMMSTVVPKFIRVWTIESSLIGSQRSGLVVFCLAIGI
jgi:hypothetical protein